IPLGYSGIYLSPFVSPQFALFAFPNGIDMDFCLHLGLTLKMMLLNRLWLFFRLFSLELFLVGPVALRYDLSFHVGVSF
ncbi:MAG: hypothetical protein AAGJ35_06305, partial [Myxococcota bacterium]